MLEEKQDRIEETVKGTQKIDFVWTMNQIGIIQVRNKSCFCILFKNNLGCVTNEAGEKRLFQ